MVVTHTIRKCTRPMFAHMQSQGVICFLIALMLGWVSNVSVVFAQPLQTSVYKVIIFDCDGVLVGNTEYAKFLAWKKALAPYGVSFTLDEYKAILGNSSKRSMALIMAAKKIDLPAEKVIAEKNEIYKKLHLQHKPKPIQPAVALVRQLVKNKKALNIKLGLASSPSKAEIMRNLKAIGLENAFDIIISGHDDLKDIHDPEGTNKPKPYIYQRAAKWLNVAPEACLVFEDSSPGVMAAFQAGMTVFAVPNEYTQQQDFSHATRVLKSLSKFDMALLH